MTLLTDDDTLPGSSSKLKMRLVDAQYGSSGNLTLSVDYTALYAASSVSLSAQSVYTMFMLADTSTTGVQRKDR